MPSYLTPKSKVIGTPNLVFRLMVFIEIFQKNLCEVNGVIIVTLHAQSWTALFRAFSSHRQPSASLTKLFPSWTRLLAELDKPYGLAQRQRVCRK